MRVPIWLQCVGIVFLTADVELHPHGIAPIFKKMY